MATKMGVMVFLVTALALGKPLVCARRDLLQSDVIPGLSSVEKALTGQTVTLVDIPGLKITSRTEAPSGGGIFNPAALLGGNGSPPTISISDRIEGTWLQPVTFTSTTEFPTNVVSSLFQTLQGAAGLPTTGSSSSSPFTGTIHAAADDDDVDVDIPDVDISKPSTTIHSSSRTNFPFPGFNLPVPKLPFPFGGPSPSPAPPASSSPSPPPRPHVRSPPAHKSPESEASPPRPHVRSPPAHKSSEAKASPPPPRHHHESPPPHERKSSDSDSPKSSDTNVRN